MSNFTEIKGTARWNPECPCWSGSVEGGMRLSSETINKIEGTRNGSDRRLRTGLIAGTAISLLISGTVWFLAVAIPAKTGSPFAPVRNLFEWLAGTGIGRGILESVYAFPIIEGFHVIGI